MTPIPCSVIQCKPCCLSAPGWPSWLHPQLESAAHNQPAPSAAPPAPAPQRRTPDDQEKKQFTRSIGRFWLLLREKKKYASNTEQTGYDCVCLVGVPAASASASYWRHRLWPWLHWVSAGRLSAPSPSLPQHSSSCSPAPCTSLQPVSAPPWWRAKSPHSPLVRQRHHTQLN